MEREYLVSAIIILVVILVISLGVWHFFPGFTSDIKRIANEVFEFGAEKTAEMEESAAETAMKELADVYRGMLAGEWPCTANFELRDIPKRYEIMVISSKLMLYDTETGAPVAESAELGTFRSCIMTTSKSYKDAASVVFYPGSLKVKVDNEEHSFLDRLYVPKFYRPDENHVCLVTDRLDEEGITALSRVKDCATKMKPSDQNAVNLFDAFVKGIKECNGKETCRCGPFDLTRPEGYSIIVRVDGGKTRFVLNDYKNENIKEYTDISYMIATIKNNREWFLIGKIEPEVYYVLYKQGKENTRYLVDESFAKDLPPCFGEEDAEFDKKTGKETYREMFSRYLYSINKNEGVKYFDLIYENAEDNKVDFFLVVSVITAESNWDPKAVSKVGAAGLMQLMPATARDMGLAVPKDTRCTSSDVSKCDFGSDERFIPEKAVKAGVRYIAWLRGYLQDRGLEPSYENIASAYNAGPGNVYRYKGIPPFTETQDYVRKVCAVYKDVAEKPACIAIS